MPLDLASALFEWLVEQSATRALRGSQSLLSGGAQEKDLRHIAGYSIDKFVEARGLEEAKAAHLRAVLSETLRLRRGQIDSVDSVHSLLSVWAEGLNAPEFGSAGYLESLGLTPAMVRDELTETIVAEIEKNARHGGSLNSVADWIWRDQSRQLLMDIGAKIDVLAGTDPASFGRKLPGQISDFTGRRLVLEELQRRVGEHDPYGIVVAIHAVGGMAGVGKTALVTHAAHELQSRYPDGSFFLDLHGFTPGVDPVSPYTALELLLRDTGISSDSIPIDLQSRHSRWRSILSDRRALIVLDNARDSDQVRPLLPMSAGSLVLITSRNVLSALPDIRLLPLGVMTPIEATELFLRATSVPDGLVAKDVHEVVQLCGYLPLAIRIVAARLRNGDSKNAPIILAEILDSLRDEREKLRELSPEAAGVQASFSASVERLPRTLRRAFIMVGLYPGPILTPTAFAALAGVPPEQSKRLLRDLSDAYLMDSMIATDGSRGYTMHDLVRAYSRRCADMELSPWQRKAALRRLTNHYVEVTESCNALLGRANARAPGPRQRMADTVFDGDQAAARAWLEQERENIAAIGLSFPVTEIAGVCQSVAGHLCEMAFWSHAKILYRHAKDIALKRKDDALAAEAFVGLGEVAALSDEYDESKRNYGAAEQIFQRIHDARGLAETARGLGTVACLTGNYTSSRSHYDSAKEIHDSLGSALGAADALRGLSTIDYLTGHLERSAQLFVRAGRAYAGTAHRIALADTNRGLAEVLVLRGDSVRSSELNASSLEAHISFGDHFGRSYSLKGLGDAAFMTTDYLSARKLYVDSFDVHTAIGDRYGQAHAYRCLADVDLALEDYPAAHRRYRLAQDLHNRLGDRLGVANSMCGIALVLIAERREQEGRVWLEQTSALYSSLGLVWVSDLIDGVCRSSAWTTLRHSQRRRMVPTPPRPSTRYIGA